MPGAKKKDDTQEILTAALTVFSQKGFAQASMADVAKATGRPVSELEKKYPSKEELLIAAFRAGRKGWRRSSDRSSGGAWRTTST